MFLLFYLFNACLDMTPTEICKILCTDYLPVRLVKLKPRLILEKEQVYTYITVGINAHGKQTEEIIIQ